ncbi:hypothetical protein [Kineosporia sp. NBRC 101731]|uniref:hypothetical protein n=1 Tax=Kineosporia sp. NBRC 101731 TaxID=3032199 RepID=UPI0024A399CA|nr:hypothetical protein [Kineosporia sp. NBRC 101731]GLY29501.1 hypothetical protein Kisp02_28660 [Kineosporia sp. NBRC 101731]
MSLPDLSQPEQPPISGPLTGGTWTPVGVLAAGIMVERLLHCLLVRPARPTPAQAEAGAQLRVFAEAADLTVSATAPGPGHALTVYIAPFSGTNLSGLLTTLREPLNRLREAGGYQQIRVVTGGVARERGSGANPFHALADALRVPVLAPLGTLLQVPGNTLFPVDGPGAGNWQRFAPGRVEPVLVGPWHFTASWGSTLPLPAPRTGESGLDVLPVPAGVVLLPHDGNASPADDITYSLPLDPRHPLVVVDRLGSSRVEPEQVAGYLRTIPDQTRHAVRVCTAATEPTPDWGRAVADALGEPVEVLTGLPLLRAGEYTSCVLRTDAAGGVEVLWEPFVSRLRYPSGAPEVAAQVTGWRSPGSDLSQSTDRVYRLDEDWVVEVLASGLWLRRSGNHARDAAVDAPFDPAEPTLLVGAPGDDLTEQAWSYVGDLTDRIGRGTGARGRVRVLGSTGSTGATGSTAGTAAPVPSLDEPDLTAFPEQPHAVSARQPGENTSASADTAGHEQADVIPSPHPRSQSLP